MAFLHLNDIFWARNIPCFCTRDSTAPGHPWEGRGTQPLLQGYPNIPRHNAQGRTSATPCKLAHLNNSHNPPTPGTQGDASSSRDLSAPPSFGWRLQDWRGSTLAPIRLRSNGSGGAEPPALCASRLLLALGRPRGAPGWRQPRQLCHVKSAAPIERVPSPGSNPITSAAVASLSPCRSTPLPGPASPRPRPISRAGEPGEHRLCI